VGETRGAAARGVDPERGVARGEGSAHLPSSDAIDAIAIGGGDGGDRSTEPASMSGTGRGGAMGNAQQKTDRLS